MNHHIKIPGLTTTTFARLSFGRQLDHWPAINAFKESAKRGWLNTKRRAVSTALREFVKLHDVKEYYFAEKQGQNWHDDSIEIWYKA